MKRTWYKITKLGSRMSSEEKVVERVGGID
jgi:hypothetical protein